MDKDEIIKSLTNQITSLQSTVKSYAKLGELYENTRAELNQLRAHNSGSERDQHRAYDGGADDQHLEHGTQLHAAGTTSLQSGASRDDVHSSGNSKIMYRAITNSVPLPLSGPGPPTTTSEPIKMPFSGSEPPTTTSEPIKMPLSGSEPPSTSSEPIKMEPTDMTVSVSRPPFSSLSLSQSVHGAVAGDAALAASNRQTDNSCEDSLTAPTIQNNNDCESFEQSNDGSLVAEKSADVSCDSAGQSSFTGKLAELVAEGKRLEQLVASKTADIEARDQLIENLTQELQQLKKGQGQGQGGVASGWVVLGTTDKGHKQDGGVSEQSSEELTEHEVLLERKITELASTVRALKTANKGWEQHLKQVNKDNTSRYQALETECNALRQQLADTGKDCDEAVATARRQAEDAEVDKQRAVAQVAEMSSKCDQLEASLALAHQREREKKTAAERRCREMENIIQGQKEYITKLEHQLMNHSTVMSTSQVPEVNVAELSLPTEVMLLHQQVALWKEDFEKERADREKAQSDLDTVRKVSLEDRQLLHKERDMCRQLKGKLEQVECEKKDLQAKLIEKMAELQRVKTDSLRHSNYPPARTAAEGPKPWNCVKCTYINTPTDRTCVMCGSIPWYHSSLGALTPSAPPRDRHLLHHHMEGPDVCDAAHLYDELPPRHGMYNRRY